MMGEAWEREIDAIEHQYNTVAASGERRVNEMTYATCSSTAETACLVLVLMLAAHGRGRVQRIYLFILFDKCYMQ